MTTFGGMMGDVAPPSPEQRVASESDAGGRAFGIVVALAGLLIVAFFAGSIVAVAGRWDEGGGDKARGRSMAQEAEVDPRGLPSGRLRAAPSLEARILRELPPHTTLTILGSSTAAGQRWYRVRAGASEGWMHADIVRFK